MNLFYDKKGDPISDTIEWGKLCQDKDYKIIRQTNINGYKVSTVWLGIDHGFDGGKPIIFETMVFPIKEDETDYGDDLDQERYCTEEEAIEGHKRIVEKYTGNGCISLF